VIRANALEDNFNFYYHDRGRVVGQSEFRKVNFPEYGFAMSLFASQRTDCFASSNAASDEEKTAPE